MVALGLLAKEEAHAAQRRVAHGVAVALVGVAIVRAVGGYEPARVGREGVDEALAFERIAIGECGGRQRIVDRLTFEPRADLVLVPGHAELGGNVVVHGDEQLVLERREQRIRPGVRRLPRDVDERHRVARDQVAGRALGERNAVGEREGLIMAVRARLLAIARQTGIEEEVPSVLEFLRRSRVLGGHDRLGEAIGQRQEPGLRDLGVARVLDLVIAAEEEEEQHYGKATRMTGVWH